MRFSFLFILLFVIGCSEDKPDMPTSNHEKQNNVEAFRELYFNEYHLVFNAIVKQYNPKVVQNPYPNELMNFINNKSEGLYTWKNTLCVEPSPDPHILFIHNKKNPANIHFFS